MSLQKRLNDLHRETIDALCKIDEFPDGLFPHTVYVEEEMEKSVICGNSVYNAYHLKRIFEDGSCILENPETGREEKRQLNEINTDWLIAVWNYHKDLSGKKEPEPVKKELYAFLYPLASFDRNAFDDKIIAGWENGLVEKLTPDEFAARINDESFDDTSLWVRFIEMEE
jgi:hypothetical protein